MVWVNSSPEILVPVPQDEGPIKMIALPHTPLLVLLTRSSTYLYNQNTLLPISYHKRSIESLNQHGYNVTLKGSNASVNTAQLQKLNRVNIFVETDLNYLIIYQVNINYSNSIFEVYNSKNDELLQSGYPLSTTAQKFSLSSLFKNATKQIILGGKEEPNNLENTEQFSNSIVEDKLGNFQISDAKINVLKILKISIGIKRYWLKQNSHNLLIFNDTDSKYDGPGLNSNVLQIINMISFKNEIFHLAEFEWYKESRSSRIKYINFNIYKNYYLFINDKKELWFMGFKVTNNGEKRSDLDLAGYKLNNFSSDHLSYDIAFNPRFNLILIKTDSLLLLFLFNHEQSNSNLNHIKDIGKWDVDIKINWSSCGNFFVLVNKETKSWCISSKFGNFTFTSSDVLNEVIKYDNGVHSIDFLSTSQIQISPNSNKIFCLNDDRSKIYIIKLLVRDVFLKDQIYYNQEYLHLIHNNNLCKFPVIPQFKRIIDGLEPSNIKPGSKFHIGLFKTSSNEYNQLCVSCGDNFAISTPYSSGNSEINHILWFNFKHFYFESLNIVNHFWFDLYLILINRTIENNTLVDEILVIDATLSRYGSSGINFKFDSDLVIWRHNFENWFINAEIIDNNNSSKFLMLLTSNLEVVVVEFSKEKPQRKSSTANLQDSNNYKIYIGLNRTIHLSSIKERLPLFNTIQISMVRKRHFLFLLDSGELYLLKNLGGSLQMNDLNQNTNNLYQLIKIANSIEYFGFQSIDYDIDALTKYLYLFNGNALLIYDLFEMIGMATSDGSDIHGNQNYLVPIQIEIEDYYPVKFTATLARNKRRLKSIELTGLENYLSYNSNSLTIKSKINHKLILNNFIEHDLERGKDLSEICKKFKSFENFNFSLELLLFKYLTEKNTFMLSVLIELIEKADSTESIYINCLRKIEVAYWDTFFDTLKATPTQFMDRLIELQNVELCYNYLIVYLNFKREGDDDRANNSLDTKDKEIILKIIKMLDDTQKWNWCYELCRFIKLLDPLGNFLQEIIDNLTNESCNFVVT